MYNVCVIKIGPAMDMILYQNANFGSQSVHLLPGASVYSPLSMFTSFLHYCPLIYNWRCI